MPIINGYLVVYFPQNCRQFFEDTNWVYRPTVRDGRIYRGMDRIPWEELEMAYHYDSNLSSDLKKIYEGMDRSIIGIIGGILICKNLKEAIRVLEFSNQKNPNSCEIIAIYSKVVSMEQAEFHSDVDIQWLGYDVARIGEWSFIEHGVLDCKELFEKWKDRLNEHGLIPDTDNYDQAFMIAKELIADYEYYEKDNRVEPMAHHKFYGESYNDIVRIGLVDMGSRGLERALGEGE